MLIPFLRPVRLLRFVRLVNPHFNVRTCQRVNVPTFLPCQSILTKKKGRYPLLGANMVMKNFPIERCSFLFVLISQKHMSDSTKLTPSPKSPRNPWHCEASPWDLALGTWHLTPENVALRSVPVGQEYRPLLRSSNLTKKVTKFPLRPNYQTI